MTNSLEMDNPLTSKAKQNGEYINDASIDISDSFANISHQLDQVKELIKSQLSNSGQSVKKLLTTFDCCKGKMLRAGLVILSGRTCGKITESHIQVATILEMIHAATLLHDDVIDDGQMRRGLPTVNSVFGNESAVLLGDFLLSKVFQLCAGLPPKAIAMLGTATGRLCQGQLCEIAERRNFNLSEAEYIKIITEKTAVLFGVCCQLGALLSNAKETQIEALYDFGLNMGIAFQITDDLLDIAGDQVQAGKTLARDLNKENLTLGIIHLLRQSDQGRRKLIEEKVSTGREKDLIEMLRSQGSFVYAHEKAKTFACKAVISINDIEDSDARNSLVSISNFAARKVF